MKYRSHPKLHVGLVGLFLASCAPVGAGVGRRPAVEASSSEGTRIDGPSPQRCDVGAAGDDAVAVAMDRFIAAPERYYGTRLSLVGYLVLGTELTRLIEPTRRKNSVYVDLSRVRAQSAQQVLDCKLKLVRVQGYVSHARMRGGDKPMIFAEALSDAVGSARLVTGR